jgi:hypothetical protein
MRPEVLTRDADDHFARMQADAQQHRWLAGAAQALVRGALHGLCGETGSQRMVFLRDRRAEQREQAVAQQLADSTTVCFHRLRHQAQGVLEVGPGFFRIGVAHVGR